MEVSGYKYIFSSSQVSNGSCDQRGRRCPGVLIVVVVHPLAIISVAVASFRVLVVVLPLVLLATLRLRAVVVVLRVLLPDRRAVAVARDRGRVEPLAEVFPPRVRAPATPARSGFRQATARRSWTRTEISTCGSSISHELVRHPRILSGAWHRYTLAQFSQQRVRPFIEPV